MLLWEEYCDANSDSFSYAWFCERYREWAGRLKPTLRQVHVAGEKLFVDYSGHTIEVVDGLSGEVRSVQIFVAVLGASNYTYAEASLTQSLPDWIASHVRAFCFFGGTARQTVSDNLKAGITRACFQSRWSTGPMPISPAITAPPSCRHGRIGRATKPMSKSGSKSSGDGSWRACATAASCRSPPSTRRSTCSLSS
ncbi:MULTISPECIES: hypothetical protein [unclassified Bradyrhizobium]|uniref:hypothetical protein n=1 Tax=unclassified Bradyrhizobium TaxID=2631580 RepID=UPI001CD27814|nr:MULTISPECIES: hypothetical protein [unclassified Bradyrhizobium]